MAVHGTLRTLFAPAVLLLGACDDPPPTVPEGFAVERFTAILDYFGEDDVMDFWRGPAHGNSKGRIIPLGDGYMAHVWRPDFAEAWGIVTEFDEDPDPGCSGRGLRFARCLKRHVDAGEESRIVKEGDSYRARFEESLSGRDRKASPAPTSRTRVATLAAFDRTGADGLRRKF